MEIIGDFPKVFAFKKVISGVLFLEVGFYFKNEFPIFALLKSIALIL
jgi:hypothetical protein